MHVNNSHTKLDEFIIYYYDRILLKRNLLTADLIALNYVVDTIEDIYQFCKNDGRLSEEETPLTRSHVYELLRKERITRLCSEKEKKYRRMVLYRDVYTKLKQDTLEKLKG
jgi:hypothetical protein